MRISELWIAIEDRTNSDPTITEAVNVEFQHWTFAPPPCLSILEAMKSRGSPPKNTKIKKNAPNASLHHDIKNSAVLINVKHCIVNNSTLSYQMVA
jgi:hypothetical protein